MTEHQVVIAGGGPTGLMLAGELALARVDVAIVERRPDQDLTGLRAGGLHIRSLELLDQRGIADRFLTQGQLHRAAPFARATLDLSDAPSRHNYFLGLWQTRIECTLAQWVGELGVPIYRGREVREFAQDEAGVAVALSDGGSLNAKYLVGCDGGRSLIRKQAGIEFAGWDPTTSYLIAEVEFSEQPEWGFRRTEKSFCAMGKLEERKGARVVLSEQQLHRGEPALSDLRDALNAAYGSDYGLCSVISLSRFTDATRQAAAYRAGRVLLAGDAAHVHSPMGGQGLNLGMQDAVNLGWKLARVVHGSSPESLLDSYCAERHPVGARVLRNTMALTALERGDPRSDALREMVSEIMRSNEARNRYVAMMSGLDVHYDLGSEHPLLGRRMPDLDLQTADGPTRVFALLHEARPLFLDLGAHTELDVEPWGVRRVDARCTAPWLLPVLGAVSAPGAVLIRPDGYVAWVEGMDLRSALTTWLGAGRSA
ncbi:MAG: monooxygenase FAD-binding protein [Myxococcaceae bacterium]|nr:monooxygenase FAD-binding protein [Myxococcaceae bacterium]